MASLYSHEDINNLLNVSDCIFCGAKQFKTYRLTQNPRLEGYDAAVAKLAITYGCTVCEALFEVKQGVCGLAQPAPSRP